MLLAKNVLKPDFKILRTTKEGEITIFTNVVLEPNSSYEIENCIKETLKPLKEVEYNFDYWFDDNDNGHFIKDNLRVDIHYGVMTDFTFYVNKNYSELELSKIETWIEKIYSCLLTKEKLRIEN